MQIIPAIGDRNLFLNKVEEVTAKNYLKQLKTLRRRANYFKGQLEVQRANAENIRSMDYSQIRVQTSPDPDPLATALDRILETEALLAETLGDYAKLYRQIHQQLADLGPGMYADVLYLRYVEGKTIAQIADELNYSYDWTRHLHGRALQEFQRRYL